MDGGSKLLLVSFSSVPAADPHAATVTATVRAVGRVFESIDLVTIKGDYLSHIERFHKSRLLRVPLVGDSAAERAESFRRALRRQIDSDAYDLVHVRSPLEGVPVLEAKSEKGYRVVYEAATFAAQDSGHHIGPQDELGPIEAQLRRDEVACASKADLVLVPSNAACQALQARGVGTAIEVVPPGVNVDLFDWQTPWETELPVLLVLGSLSPWRDVPNVLEALRRILEESPVLLRWIGEPDERKRELVQTYAAELGVGATTSFEAPVELEALPRLISAATVCLAPAAPVERYTDWGDCPAGILEHMACRKPVVASRTPGVEEIVRDGTEALFFTPGDPAGLASAVLFLLKNPRQRRLLADRGYRRVREHFSASAQRRLLLESYLRLVGPGSVGASPQAAPTEDLDGDAGETEGTPSSVDIVTAVMHAVEETSRIQVQGDGAPAEGAPTEEHADTNPSIEAKVPAEHPRSETGTWLLPEARPATENAPADDDTGRVKTRKVHPEALKTEDTSRIAGERPTGERPTEPEPLD